MEEFEKARERFYLVFFFGSLFFSFVILNSLHILWPYFWMSFNNGSR